MIFLIIQKVLISNIHSVIQSNKYYQACKEIPGLISFTTDWLDLLAVQGLSRVFSNSTVQKHQFFGAQLSSQSNSHIPFPFPGDLPNPGIKPVSPAWQADSLLSEPTYIHSSPNFPPIHLTNCILYSL